MKKVIVLLVSLIASAAQAANWEYNGSLFRLEASGGSRKFFYESPRAGLPVARGTLVFSGQKSGNAYSGTAYVFSQPCGAIGYAVSGPVSEDQRTVTLRGNVPVRNAKCKVTGYQNNELVFNFQDGAAPAKENQTRAGAGEQVKIGINAFGFHPDLCGTNQSGISVFQPTAAVARDFRDLIAGTNLGHVELRESNVSQACALTV